MKNFQVVNHPLVKHKLALLRSVETETKLFRELIDELTLLVGMEATKELALEEIQVETPLTITAQHRLAKKTLIVPILRAGIGMVEGMLQLLPTAAVGHIGMYRDEETLQPAEYLLKLPEAIDACEILVVDPMLATGGSANLALDSLKKRGAKNIRFLCLVSAPEGVRVVQEAHPDVKIFTAVLDEKLNEHGYIVPGLGDAGDRLFGTK